MKNLILILLIMFCCSPAFCSVEISKQDDFKQEKRAIKKKNAHKVAKDKNGRIWGIFSIPFFVGCIAFVIAGIIAGSFIFWLVGAALFLVGMIFLIISLLENKK